MRKRSHWNVKKTTTTDHHIIDWVTLESQGEIASPPSIDHLVKRGSGNAPLAELEKRGVELGPPGTVPIPRANLDYLNTVVEKRAPYIESAGSQSKRDKVLGGRSWYVTANQTIPNHGGNAYFSLYRPYVSNNNDYSLMQQAITRSDVNGGQTLEVGWIHYPNQKSQPHLFTYYTTNGYSAIGDNIGGWNQDVAGWVQYDATVFPGTVYDVSVEGGVQNELWLFYWLYKGNWWLYVNSKAIGYYPAKLFMNDINSITLANESDIIYYYGAVYQADGSLPTTDMGSGRFAETGKGHAAYMHNLNYMDTNKATMSFKGNFTDSDSTMYNHVNFVAPVAHSVPSDWESYAYLGGPGAGSVTGG
ncbi:hypothetical protein GQ53DRAFT_656364 [Thozetella sp. PMI_491]|nr:hypothetical protein GQ53DRAFT_656364 [Thozetella sp. PMI_491]